MLAGWGNRSPMRSRLLCCILWGPLLVLGDDLGTLESCQAQNERLAVRIAELEAQLAEVTAAEATVSAAERPSRLNAFLQRGFDEPLFAGRRLECEEALVQPGTPEFYQHTAMALVCVCLAAMAAGLTIGLVSLEVMEMEIIVSTEEQDMPANKDKQRLKDNKLNAKKLLPLIQDHHRLLVTLLLMNSFANEALPLFLDQLVPSWLAVLMSMTLVLIFGEIIPSAIFTGSDQLRMAASFAPVVIFFRSILAPVAWPIAKILDCLLGADHKGRYNFAELRAIVDIHAKLHVHSEAVFKSVDDDGIITTEARNDFTEETAVTFVGVDSDEGKSSKLEANTIYYVKPCPKPRSRDHGLSFQLFTSEERLAKDLIKLKSGDITSGIFRVQERDELKIMHGVMKLTHMTAKHNMVSLSKVEMLEINTKIDAPALKKILEDGYSRLPVYDRLKHNVRGFLLVKRLIVVSPNEGGTVGGQHIENMVVVHEDIGMLDLLNKFQEKRIHIALVTNDPEAVERAWDKKEEIPPDVHMAGIITLEDIIEKLIQEEIDDEHDRVPGRSGVKGGPSGYLARSVSRSFMPGLDSDGRGSATSHDGLQGRNASFRDREGSYRAPEKAHALEQPLLEKISSAAGSA